MSVNDPRREQTEQDRRREADLTDPHRERSDNDPLQAPDERDAPGRDADRHRDHDHK